MFNKKKITSLLISTRIYVNMCLFIIWIQYNSSTLQDDSLL